MSIREKIAKGIYEKIRERKWIKNVANKKKSKKEKEKDVRKKNCIEKGRKSVRRH